MDMQEIIQRSMAIRKHYHSLEEEYHRSIWSIEEDALAFLTDAGLVGRQTMAQQGRWPSSNDELQHKLGECIWWLTILAERMNLSIEDCVEQFLATTEKRFGL